MATYQIKLIGDWGSEVVVIIDAEDQKEAEGKAIQFAIMRTEPADYWDELLGCETKREHFDSNSIKENNEVDLRRFPYIHVG